MDHGCVYAFGDSFYRMHTVTKVIGAAEVDAYAYIS